MAQTHLEVFPSEYHMLKFFGKYLPLLDVDTSAKLTPYLYKYDGNLVLARNLFEFLTQIESLVGLGINTKASVQKGKAILVFFDKELKDAEEFSKNAKPKLGDNHKIITVPTVSVSDIITTDTIQTTNPPASDVIIENNGKEPVIPQEKVITVEDAEEQQRKLDIMKQAEELRDDSKKAAAKSALEEFALKHNVSLSKAKTFDGMLEDLKAAL